MPVNSNESTGKGAAQGQSFDNLITPISGVSFGGASVFQQVTIQGVATITASANFSQMTVSGLMTNNASGIVILQNVSGAATGGSGGTFSGKDPVGYFAFQTAAGALAKVPYFS